MTDLYLIAHKVRGEPAFDVATRMECPHCEGAGGTHHEHCIECDSLGYWWIIPTSGHRAYPYWNQILGMRFYHTDEGGIERGEWAEDIAARMPPDLPDHYRTRAAPPLDLTSILGLIHKPLAPIKRRF